MADWLEKGLRERLFADVPVDVGVWIGNVVEIGSDREIVPVRFAGLDFWFAFLSPHAESGNDSDFLIQMLDMADVKDFVPCKASRLIKFCRADAQEHHFQPADWHLPAALQIFQFLQVLADVMRLYLDAMPEVEQFLYLPASERLGRLYKRVFRLLSKEAGSQIEAIILPTGICHAYQRT